MDMEKKALALCITLAISNNSFAAEKNVYQNTEITSAHCSESVTVNQNNRCIPDDQNEGWLAAGLSAVALAAGIAMYNNHESGEYHVADSLQPTPDPVPDPTPDPTPDPVPDPTPDPDPIPDPEPKTITTYITEDVSAIGQGAIGALIESTPTNMVINANITAKEGGTGIQINGDDATINNSGDSFIDGKGSTGIFINGGNADITTSGDASVSNDGIGLRIDGDNTRINLLNDDGNIPTLDINSGGRWAVLNGDSSTLSIDTISAVIQDENSALVQVTGKDSSLSLSGDILVENASHGIDIIGDNNSVITDARIIVKDKYSSGINIAGAGATFKNTGDINVSLNGNGANITGDGALILLDGNVNVASVRKDDGILQLGDGIVVAGNSSTIDIVGNVSLSGENIGPDKVDMVIGDMHGIFVTGDNNTLSLDGVLNVSGEGIPSLSGGSASYQGINISGENNNISVGGGINLDVRDNGLQQDLRNKITPMTYQGVTITGQNTVHVNGHSTITNDTGATSYTTLANISAGGQFLLTEDSVLDIHYQSTNLVTDEEFGMIRAADTGSFASNAGTINMVDGSLGVIMKAGSGSSVSNSGVINTMSIQSKGGSPQVALILAEDKDSTATNSGLIRVISDGKPAVNSQSNVNAYPLRGIHQTIYAMESNTGGVVTNDAEGVIELTGAGTFGPSAGSRGSTLAQAGSAYNLGSVSLDGFVPVIDENGNVTGKTAYEVSDSQAYYRGAGMISGSTDKGYGYNATATNAGNINVTNSGFGMLALKGGTVTNQGIITLSADEGTVKDSSTSQLIGLGAMLGGKAINDTDGIININTDIGRAFYVDSGQGSSIINKGTINYMGAPDDGSHMGSTPALQSLQGYIVGTSANGSAGQFNGSNVDVSGVTVNTGFTTGTAAKTETFDNVFQGSNIAGAENIQSDSVVWNAQGTQDTNGNVDVTMTKNDYRDVADASVSSVAGALEAGYSNTALYQSLNLKSTAEVTHAMRQLSGSTATRAFNDARVLSHRFDMLAEKTVVGESGLGFNVVAKGDQRAQLSGNARYDMLALSQTLNLSSTQSLNMEYGIARLDGNGDMASAGDNSLTGGYSQFFGLKHSLKLNDNLSWENALRYDNHQLDSSRSIRYGSVNEMANASNSQQYIEMKTALTKGFELGQSLKFTPSVGAKLRHTRDGSYGETGANDYNLKMDAATETAVDAIAGMELTYIGKDGWAATAKVEGGPNLSYSKSARTASLQGASGQQFSVNDDQQGGGINSLSQLGVNYRSGNKALAVDAFNWQEDDITDRGVMMNVKVDF